MGVGEGGEGNLVKEATKFGRRARQSLVIVVLLKELPGIQTVNT